MKRLPCPVHIFAETRSPLLMAQLCTVVLVGGLLIGCNADAPPAVESPSSPTSALEPEVNATVDTNRAVDAVEFDAAEVQLTPASLGPVQVGMEVNRVAQVLGAPLLTLDGRPLPDTVATESCYYSRSPKLEGAEFMLNWGTVVRIDIAAGSPIQTSTGVGIGSSTEEVEQAYGDQIKAEPNKYLPEGETLVVIPSNTSDKRLVFETDGQQVTNMRAGRTPEAEFVERCG